MYWIRSWLNFRRYAATGDWSGGEMGISLLRNQRVLTPVLLLALATGHTPERHTLVKSPRAILLYGETLAQPVVIQTRAATAIFLAALVPDTTSATANSIRDGGTSGTVSVAVFWSPPPFGLP